MRVMRSPARPSPIARTIGIAPPTAASKRSCRPCRAASVSSVGAVARDRPACSRSPPTCRRAAPRESSRRPARAPPIASTTTSASLWSTSSIDEVQATDVRCAATRASRRRGGRRMCVSWMFGEERLGRERGGGRRPNRRCRNRAVRHDSGNSRSLVSLISPRAARGRNWHLNRDEGRRVVAVASQGQSLSHS